MTTVVANNNTIEDWNTAMIEVETLPNGDVIFADGSVFYAPSSSRERSSSQVIAHQVCKQCGDSKPLSSFRANKDGANGVRNVCKRCMSTKKTKAAGIDHETVSHDVWVAEAKIACPCVVCGEEIDLPDDVKSAESALRSGVPLCHDHADGKSIRARMAARNWASLVDERISIINAWYTMTTTLMRAPKLRTSIGHDALRWLAGVRCEDDGDTSVVNTILATRMSDLSERLADNNLKRDLPKTLNYNSQQKIIAHEIEMAVLIGDNDLTDDDVFAHLIDN